MTSAWPQFTQQHLHTAIDSVRSLYSRSLILQSSSAYRSPAGVAAASAALPTAYSSPVGIFVRRKFAGVRRAHLAARPSLFARFGQRRTDSPSMPEGRGYRVE